MIDTSIIENNPFLLSEEKMSALIDKDRASLQITSISEGCTGIIWIKLHWNSVTTIERALLRPDAYDCCHNWSDEKMSYEFDGYLVWIGLLEDAPNYIKDLYKKVIESEEDPDNPNSAGHGEIDDDYIDITKDNDTWQGYDSSWLKQVNITLSFNKRLLYKCQDMYLPVIGNASTLAYWSTALNNNKDEYDIIYKEYENRIQLIQDNFFPWNASFTIHDIISNRNANCTCWDVDPFYFTYNHYKLFDSYGQESNKYLNLKAKYREDSNIIFITITSDKFDKSDKVQLFWKWVDELYKFDSIMSIVNNSIYYKKND